jgi:GNAT superfamily N-acetyltransferase
VDIVAAHEARLRGLDPLLPRRHPLPEPPSGATRTVVDGAIANAAKVEAEPGTPAADWGRLREYRISPRVGGPDPVAAMDAILSVWSASVLADAAPEDRESAAMINWPSRDAVMTRAFLDRGLTPSRVLAVRPAGRPGPGAPSSGVRPMITADLDDVVALHVEEIRWGVQFGGTALRAEAADVARREYTGVLERDDPWTWVAERDGRVVGMITVTPPGPGPWFGPLSSASNPAYVGTTVVAPTERSGGVGAALAGTAHAALDAAGVDLTLLHYSPLNPLSAPFWNRCGYRPLWTWWAATPASRLRPGRHI